jgi:hypothetical protein
VILAALACRRKKDSKASAAASATATATATADAADSEQAQKARVAKKVAKLEAIGATRLPPISTKASLKANSLKPELNGYVNKPNTAIVTPEMLPALRLDVTNPAFASGAPTWCAALIRGKKPTVDSTYLDQCDTFRYVVVVRYARFVKPRMTGPSSFQPGSCTGDATVFDWETGERLGSVPYSATNASQIDATQGMEQLRVTRELERQCGWAVQRSIDKVYGETPKQ